MSEWDLSMSVKVKDDKNRWRNKTVAFRLSPEEAADLDNRVKLLGYRTKQDYILDALFKSKVVAVGNAEMLVQFKKNLTEILAELKRLEKASDMDEELMTPIETMLKILDAVQHKDELKKEERISEPQYDQMMHLQHLKELMRYQERIKNEQSNSDSKSEGWSREDNNSSESGSRPGKRG